MKQPLTGFLWISIVLLVIIGTGCSKELSRAELKERINELLERADANMVFVEGGSFIMGNQPPNYKELVPTLVNNAHQHKVTLSDYYISKYETTLVDFQIFAQATNNYIAEINTEKIKGRSPKSPINRVSWEDANNYCQWLADLTGKPYRLPTEAEWEYAARSRGQDVKYATDDNTLKPAINTEPIEFLSWAASVDAYLPNPLGIYGMESGYAEWVSDWYSSDYFFHSPEKDPQGPAEGTEKVIRGAHKNRDQTFKYLYKRKSMEPIPRDHSFIGFRCAQSAI
ncbi:SUMF1/EgtB/PvdO family nonheme iron enzyme [Endozoicomonas sp. SM1973]|uniref:SUMF1/EgtB/PvdO family nonheme iron enzyme n=1 Tax=Spartinivicinus marinus TaxID=2994442 RepID=A0A853IPB9_9GAMM|nr:SUMF1/EgtB/PvdO family nonheme iron enzyme [Spartinivicinus marinus]MCX4028224.1 SUMF1/EgtB/PvdO family nonheme iron enzyme [Spartinivicinus marinus]NYZ69736.1 SUMF1/EgtB/PvdO family nonheme iron enzyme [Spartinivicinus marinus]